MAKSKAVVGFHNGYGNWVMFTTAIRALSQHTQQKVDVLLDSSWDGHTVIAEQASMLTQFVDKVHTDLNRLGDYNIRYMSHHRVDDEVFRAIYPETDIFNFPVWQDSLCHEIDWYMWELYREFSVMVSTPMQLVTVGKVVHEVPKDYFVISNGYLRTRDGLYGRKQYNFWNEVIEGLKWLYPSKYIVAVGGVDDKDWGSSLHDVVNLTGETSWDETAAILLGSKGVITTDTGVMHVADAVGTPGVALFGPTLISKNGPYNRNIIPLDASKNCSPCQGTQKYLSCTGGCMDDIKPGTVLSAFRKLVTDFC